MNDEHFKRGVDEFNRSAFFEAHDILEALWMETNGPDRLFLQGLIQVSVGFYHFFNSNYKGATSQFTKGLDKLDKYRPSYSGLELDHFSMSVVRWLALAERGVTGEPIYFDESTLPKLQQLQPQE